MAHQAGAVRSAYCTSATSSGRSQCTPRASAPRGGSENGGVFCSRRASLACSSRERLLREASPDLAGVAQRATRVVAAEQQRAEMPARAGRFGIAADHELLARHALDLEPCARSARAVRRLRALADHALDAELARVREEARAAAAHVVVVAQAARVRAGRNVSRSAALRSSNGSSRRSRSSRYSRSNAKYVQTSSRPDCSEFCRRWKSLTPSSRRTHSSPSISARDTGSAGANAQPKACASSSRGRGV